MEEGDLVLCKVKKVTNTITSVELPNGEEGTIISPEIAAGRIKFMRQYVVPNKQIVCKILKIEGDNIHLSLRRVTSKEKKEIMQNFKQAQAVDVAFRQILKEDAEEVKKYVLDNFESLLQFTKEARKFPEIIKQYIPEKQREAIEKIINKKRKQSQLRQNIKIKCTEEDGVNRIKKIFNLKNDNIKVIYISAGHLSLRLMVDDFKQGKKEMNDILKEIENRAKENNCEFSSTEDK